MDLNEIEKGTESDVRMEAVRKENKGTANRCPLRSISADGNTGDYLYKKPYSYTRQNSINDSREYNALKDNKEKDLVNSKLHIGVHRPTVNKPRNDDLKDNIFVKTSYERQISNISSSQELLEKDGFLPSCKKMAENDLVEVELGGRGDEYSADPTRIDRRNWRNGCCLYTTSGCSCLLSVLAVGLVLLVILGVSNFTDNQRQEISANMGLSHSGHASSEVNTAGSFRINQTHLAEYQKVVWLKDENSEIIPSSVDNCLTVPYYGKYLVVSRFTFNIPLGDDTDALIHSFKLKTRAGKQKDGGFKRKYVSLLENKLRTDAEVTANQEMRKPSVFIEFFDLDAYDQICPNVSIPSLLYKSVMDNDVNIIKV